MNHPVTEWPKYNLAKGFAFGAHGQQRYGKAPYSAHLEAVVQVLLSEGFVSNIPLLCAAWLHDVLEDTDFTAQDLMPLFGAQVVDLVVSVTDEPGATRAERKAKTLPKTRKGGSNAVALKLADRIANVEAVVKEAQASEPHRGVEWQEKHRMDTDCLHGCASDTEHQNLRLHSLFKMYRDEQAQFIMVLYVKDEHENLWTRLSNALL